MADGLRVALIWNEHSGHARYDGINVPLRNAPVVPRLGRVVRIGYVPLMHMRTIQLVGEAERPMTTHEVHLVDQWLHERTSQVRALFEWDGRERRGRQVEIT